MTEENKNNGAEESGFPRDNVKLEMPSINANADEAEEQDEKSENKRAVLSVAVLLILLGFGVLGAFGYFAVVWLAGDEKPAIETSSVDISTEGAERSTVTNIEAATPPLPVIERNQTPKGLEIFSSERPNGGGVDLESIGGGYEPDSDIKQQLTQLSLDVKSVVESLNTISGRLNKIGDDNEKLSLNISNIKSKVDGLMTGVETVAGRIQMQGVKVDTLVNDKKSESEERNISARKPPFSIRGKTIWGDVVYLTVAIDGNFQQQVITGKPVGDWTLRKVDLAKNKSFWTHVNGNSYEIAIP